MKHPSRLLTLALLPLSLLTLGSAPAAAQGSWSADFARPGLLGRVFALGTYQGELVAGGLGLEATGDSNLGLVARFDGSHWQRLPGGPSSGSPNQVRALHEWQGELYMGGQFHSANGQVVNDIARWDGNAWSDVGGGVSGNVWSMAVFRGELIVGGEFPTAGGTSVNSIAAWNGSTWRSLAGGMPQGLVRTLAVGADDRLYAAGAFDTAGGVTANSIAVWDGSSWSPLGSGFPLPLNATIWDLAFFGGSLYACGNTDLVPGGASNEKVARWTGSSWVSAGVFPDTSIGTSVYALLTDSGGLYAAGNFAEADGTFVESIARFDGASWTFVGGVSGSGQITTVFDLIAHQGKLISGGEFTRAGFSFGPGQATITHSIASYDGSAWSGLGTGLGLNAQTRDGVLWNDRPVVAGSFDEAGGEVVGGLVQFDGSQWRSLGSFGGGRVNSVTVIGADLYAGGDFSSVDGQPIAGVARFDGVQWSGFGSGTEGSAVAEYQGQLYAGGLGGVRRWNGSSWEMFAPQLFGFVYDLHVHAGVLYIGGSMAGSNHLVSWDGTTQQTVAGSGTNGSVYTLHSFQGDLLVGGVFSQAGGVAAQTLARWDGTSFQPFGNLTGTQVDSLTLFQGELHAGGNLFVPGFPPEKYIARWDGSGWQPLAGGLQGYVGALMPDETRGQLWVTGLFGETDGLPAWHVGRWDNGPAELGDRFCDASPNSTGAGATLHATGSVLVAQNQLQLRSESLPPGTSGLFFYGTQRIQVPFGEGLRCAGGTTRRLQPPGASDASGVAQRTLDLAAPPAVGSVVPGALLSFQYWYRDPMGGPSGFNSSDAVEIAFE